MAFPSTGGQAMLAAALQEAQQAAASVKGEAQSLHDQSAVAPEVTALDIIDTFSSLKTRLDRLNALAATAGMSDYARDQFDDPALDIGVEFSAMTAAIQSFLDWVDDNIVKSVSGHIEERLIEANDTITAKTYTISQTTGMRSELNALIATID